MQHYMSDNNLFRIDVHEDGHISLHRLNCPDVFMKDNGQVFELFSLLCLLITDHIIPQGFEWMVSEQQPEVIDLPDDDIPF